MSSSSKGKSKRFFGFLFLIAVAAFFFSQYSIEGIEHLQVKRRTKPLVDIFEGWSLAGSDRPVSPVGAPDRSTDTITIASFNIQVFGEKKLSDPEVTGKLAELVRQFDVVAIQEIRAKNQDVLPTFVELVNEDGNYDYLISQRLGRTTSKEQYAFVYNRDRVEVDSRFVYVIGDPGDRLHREPFVARFRARYEPVSEGFSFTLINIHTDPDETSGELNALDDAFMAVMQDGSGEDDIILLGDLNVDDRSFGELGQVHNITWAISGVTTNTRGTKLYDNILFSKRATSEFTGRSGVLDFKRHFEINLERALEISDHMPVWAQFKVREDARPSDIAAVEDSDRG